MVTVVNAQVGAKLIGIEGSGTRGATWDRHELCLQKWSMRG